jgi:hypothetical protein
MDRQRTTAASRTSCGIAFGGSPAQLLDARHEFYHSRKRPWRRVAGEHSGTDQAAIGALIKLDDELHAARMHCPGGPVPRESP